ncbi:MAG: hypothetical protein AB8B50_21130 [Pirellulaceae bacterium]
MTTKPSESESLPIGREAWRVIFLVGFLLVAFFVSGLCLLWHGIHERHRLGNGSWKSKQAEVIESRIVELNNPEYMMYEASEAIRRRIPKNVPGREVTYVYFDGDDRHTGSDILGQSSAGSLLVPMPPKVVVVHYEADSPAESSLTAPEDQLDENSNAIILGPIFMLPMVIAVILAVWFLIDTRNKTP